MMVPYERNYNPRVDLFGNITIGGVTVPPRLGALLAILPAILLGVVRCLRECVCLVAVSLACLLAFWSRLLEQQATSSFAVSAYA